MKKRKNDNRTFENEKQKQDKTYDKKKEKYRNDKRDEKFKSKTYLIADKKQNDNNQNSDNCENYNQSHDLEYFDSNYEYNESKNTDTLTLINTINFTCRRCANAFTSNNQFYKHLRNAKCIKSFKSCKLLKHIQNTNVYFNVVMFLIHFQVDLHKEINTEYNFKK